MGPFHLSFTMLLAVVAAMERSRFGAHVVKTTGVDDPKPKDVADDLLHSFLNPPAKAEPVAATEEVKVAPAVVQEELKEAKEVLAKAVDVMTTAQSFYERIAAVVEKSAEPAVEKSEPVVEKSPEKVEKEPAPEVELRGGANVDETDEPPADPEPEEPEETPEEPAEEEPEEAPKAPEARVESTDRPEIELRGGAASSDVDPWHPLPKPKRFSGVIDSSPMTHQKAHNHGIATNQLTTHFDSLSANSFFSSV